MKKTAVEWLEEICNDRGYHLMSEYFEQAKEMEKQQIIDAGQECFYCGWDIANKFKPKFRTAEQYYNAIFFQFGKIPTNFIPTLKTEIQNEIEYLKSIKQKI